MSQKRLSIGISSVTKKLGGTRTSQKKTRKKLSKSEEHPACEGNDQAQSNDQGELHVKVGQETGNFTDFCPSNPPQRSWKETLQISEAPETGRASKAKM